MILVGADPEVLLSDGSRFVSAIGKIPGTKDEPMETEHGKIHVDNVAGEFNIKPAVSVDDFSHQVGLMLHTMEEMAAKHGLKVSQDCAGEYDLEELYHPEAAFAGCNPDMNAYTRRMNRVPELMSTKYRCAGGHIHIGTEIKQRYIPQLVKVLDLLVTIPLMKHENPQRRAIYGGAGAYRVKPYGVEYRTPSNFWIFKPERRGWIYNQVMKALEGYGAIEIPDGLQETINAHDLQYASKLINNLSLVECPQ